jgi:hypothetical protein
MASDMLGMLDSLFQVLNVEKMIARFLGSLNTKLGQSSTHTRSL